MHTKARIVIAFAGRRRIFVVAPLVVLLSASATLAAQCTVTSLADSGVGSLREAIGTANPCDTIVFSVTGTITLTGGELSINKNLAIMGPGAESLAISGNKLSRVFNIMPFTAVAISDVTIENGKSAFSNGGGINNSGKLMVTRSTFSGNSAADGGGIVNFGTLTVTNSTFSGNSATENSGGIANTGMLTVTNSTFSGNSAPNGSGGSIGNAGTVKVINSTFSGNFAPNGNGGVINNSGTVTVTNSTFSGNFAADGGGITNFGTVKVSNSTFSGNSGPAGGGGIANAGTLTVKNTLLAKSPAGGNCSGSITSQGHNLSDDFTCPFTQTTDIMNNTPAGLDPGGLKNNGGPTQTIALLATSPAVDAIPVSDCTDVDGNPVATDQRGVTRPQGPKCDIGAFELVFQVGIDIKPGSFPNSINPKSLGKIPVAILSSSTLDAPTMVDRTSLTFGRTGNEQSLAFCNLGGEDVNGDGLLDLVCHFNTPQTGFQAGDTAGVLKGKTVSNIPIKGSDSVRIVP
jgi:hypothetical protein